MVRAPFYDENGVKKGAWSADEDEKLKAYVQKHGHCNWRELPRFAGLSRCGKSCRLRWINYLRPEVKRGNYSKEEEDLILKLHQQYGNKWSLIATRLPGRTDNEIKNYWHTHLKKLKTSKVTKKQQNEAIPKPKPIQKRESSSEINKTNLANQIIPSHQIFESSPLSPLSYELSSNVFSTQDSAASTIDMAAEENSPAPTTTSFSFQEPKYDNDGDFWARPFEAADHSLEVESGHLIPFECIGGFNSPYDLIFDQDLMTYQVMKELLSYQNYQSKLYD